MVLAQIGFVFLLFTADILAVQESDLRLQEYLEARKLGRLSLRLLETQYASELEPSRRLALVNDLIDRYRELLFERDASKDSQRIVKRAESLVRDYPELASQKLRIAIAHARYTQAESNFLGWWKNGAPANERNELLQSLTNLEAELKRIIDNNDLSRDETLALIPLGDNETRLRQAKLDQIEARIVHASYLTGWTNYFQAIASVELDSDRLGKICRSFSAIFTDRGRAAC